ncbi:MAG: hypothetical protein HY925_13705 [Elusimicrobia bacterium]|nr:hypothetical protein [Elusimicrobiota bacterium]
MASELELRIDAPERMVFGKPRWVWVPIGMIAAFPIFVGYSLITRPTKTLTDDIGLLVMAGGVGLFIAVAALAVALYCDELHIDLRERTYRRLKGTWGRVRVSKTGPLDDFKKLRLSPGALKHQSPGEPLRIYRVVNLRLVFQDDSRPISILETTNVASARELMVRIAKRLDIPWDDLTTRSQ